MVLTSLLSTFLIIGCFVVLFTILIATTGGNDSIKSKKHSRKSISVVFLVLGFFALFIFGISVLINYSYRRSSDGSNTVADGFTIEEYRIEMNVDETEKIDITEYITVNFFEEGHHGIYRTIPVWLEYTNKNGETTSRKATVSHLTAVTDEFSLENEDGKEKIRIGDPFRTLPIGDHTYQIHYVYDMGADPYDNFDEFIFHAFGDYWGTTIQNASITIHMPKPIDDPSKIKFFNDKFRNVDITKFVEYQVDESTIHIKVSPDYELRKSLTIDMELPDHYFESGSHNYGFHSLLLCLICIGFAIAVFVLWLKHGKDFPKVPASVEFYPPEGLDAAEIGYISKGDTGKKLAIAVILELAKKGFIKIDEDEEKKVTISKKVTTDLNKYINRTIKIKKLKEYKAPFFDINVASTGLMNQYLPKGVNEAVITSDFSNVCSGADYLIENGYITLEDSISQYSKEQLESMKNELKSHEFDGKPQMTANEKMVYDALFGEGETQEKYIGGSFNNYPDTTVLKENTSFYQVFRKINENVSGTWDDKIHDITAYRSMLIGSIFFLCSILCWGMAYCFYEDLDPKISFLYYLAIISIALIFFFVLIMKRRTEFGEQLKAKVDGFENYIEVAEKGQIDMLVEKNPMYFYDILPYAYVLGISKKWSEKFENIPVPSSDMGSLNYYDTTSLDTISSSVYYPSSSGSSSGCGGGGGCSSCGGGCSSCGGGGSW